MTIIKEKNCVYIEDETHTKRAYVTFPFVGDRVVAIDHTYVDECLRGMNLASQLMRAALEVIREEGHQVTLKGSYAMAWFEKHPEEKDVLLRRS